MHAPVLRALFLDVDDTLYSTSEFSAAARRKAVEAMVEAGLRVCADEAYRELQEVIREFSANYPHHFDQLLSRLPPEASAGVNRALLVSAGIVAYHETKVRALHPYEDAVAALKRLSRTPLILGVITAGLEMKQAEKLIRLRIHRHLRPDAIFITDQVGIGKPNPKLFLRACEGVCVRPGEAMYVGDNPVMDLDPAHRAGLLTVHHRRAGRYADLRGEFPPDYEIHNFYDLLEILERDFGVRTQEQ